MRSLIKIITPDFIINAYKKQKSKKRRSKREELAKLGQVITQKEIETALTEAGIKNGDVAMLHSSLSSLGNVEGGAITVINAFMNVLGDNGTLVMPSFPAIGYNFDYLSGNPVFDIKQTPSKMGIITEVFRKMDGVKRSFHPTDSVCAIGKEAEMLTIGHFGQHTPYNNNSPFYKLTQLNSKILLIGVQLETVTNFHTPEDAIPDFKYPVYHPKVFNARMIDESGNAQAMTTNVHDPVFSKQRKCNEFKEPFLTNGIAREFKLGLANCMVIEANRMHAWLIESYYKGITIYTPHGKDLN